MKNNFLRIRFLTVFSLACLAAGCKSAPVRENRPAGRLMLRKGHGSMITCLSYSPDGRYLATGSEDCTVKLWNTADGNELWTFSDFITSVSAVAYSPDGKTIAAGSEDFTVKFIDAANGNLESICRLPDLKYDICAPCNVLFSPDGSRLYVNSEKNSESCLYVCNAKTGNIIQIIKLNTNRLIRTFDIAPDGNSIAAGTSEGNLLLIDVKTRKVVKTLNVSKGGIQKVRFNPNGRSFAVLGDYQDNTLRVFDSVSLEEKFRSAGKKVVPDDICYFPGGKILAVIGVGPENTLQAIDAEQGKFLDGKNINGIHISVSTTDTGDLSFAVTDYTDACTEWNYSESGKLHILKGPAAAMTGICCSPDGLLTASVSSDDMIAVWNSADFCQKVSFKTDLHSSRISFDAEGKRIYAAAGNQIDVYDAVAGSLIDTWDISFTDEDEMIEQFSVNPRGKIVLVGGNRGSVIAVDSGTGAVISSFSAGKDTVSHIVFSPDGTLFGVSIESYDDESYEIAVYDTETQKCICTIGGFINNITGFAFTPDGKSVYGIDHSGNYIMYDISAGSRKKMICIDNAVKKFPPSNQGFWSAAAVSSKGTYTALITSINRIYLSRTDDIVPDYNPIIINTGNGDITDAVFSPDEKELITSYRNGTACVWDTMTGSCVVSFMAAENNRWVTWKNNDFTGNGLSSVLYYLDGRTVSPYQTASKEAD